MDAQVFDLERSRTSGDGMEEEMSNSTKLEQTSKREDDHRNVTRYPTAAIIKENIHRKYATSNATDANSTLPLPGLHLLYRRSDGVKRNVAPVVPKGELVQMRPRLVTSPVRLTEHSVKPPKFIPYEPYPGATNLMVPCNKITEKIMTSKKNNNNLDIGVLVSQMCTLRAQEMDPKPCKEQRNDVINVKLEEELRKTKEERDYYQGQFRFQVQVNSELKNLLVASVGEDLQTHVNVLTEDKLQLARALLDTAKNLTTHTVNFHLR